MNNRESGNVFTVLLASIAIAGALSAILYQTLSGPLSSMVRIANKTTARMDLRTGGDILLAAAHPCPAEPRDGVKPPAGGGLIPPESGAALTDPWGQDFGYCAWDLGDPACGGKRLHTENAAPNAPVIAVISAGPDRAFQTSCTEAGLVPGGDDLVQSYSAAELKQGGLEARVEALEQKLDALKKEP